VSKVADAKDTSPMDLDPLGKNIDPEALEILVSSGSFLEIRFGYEGYTVVIDRNRNLTLQ
jgi:hypothetical protein